MTPIPDFESFAAAAAGGTDVVALSTPLAFDHETAVALADRFMAREHVFLLESATAGPNARYSFVGFDPLWSWRVADAAQGTAVYMDGKGISTRPLVGGDPIASLRELVRGVKLASAYPKGVRLGGPDVAAMVGPVGFFGYGIAAALEPAVGRAPAKTLGLPDAFFFLPRVFLVLDHLARRLFVTRLVPVAGRVGAGLKTVYETEVAQLAELVKELGAAHVPRPLAATVSDAAPDFEACEAVFTKAAFAERVEACLEDIRAGEIFQIQIGNRLSVRTSARPFDVFRHLRMLNPSPYMFYYRIGEHHILGASPEMMVGVDGGTVTHRPIAGTRRRTWETRRDAAMRRELVESEKERAEHVMLVDLARNDVGRIAAPGSVKVDELMMVEEYSHVFHMVSQVSGTLASGKDAFDALTAGFPNGTVSGAPKIRAMQLINRHELVGREFYAGSLGMFDFRGNLRSTILIRTIHMARGVASTQASAGIVYDSVADDEWLETRNKMAACVLAMQRTR